MNIVITGMGAITPVGIGVPAYWNGILSGAQGIRDITKIDTARLPVHAAGEVRDFDAKDHFPSRLAQDLDPFMQFAYAAAEEALAQSGLADGSSRIGIVMGTALAGVTLTGATQEALTRNEKPVGPRFVSRIMGNIAASQFAISHAFSGPSLTVSTACSSGGDAVTLGNLLLCAGEADAVVVMAGESAISPLVIGSLFRAGALSRSGRSLPFDAARDGFVIGEGGGAVVLETEESARKRGARILSRLLGCATNNDAHHVVSPEPNGAGASACMRLALERAQLSPDCIGYVNAHGTATIRGDAAESNALRAVFGARAVPVSSTKGATGHMMAAGGLTELIASVLCIENRIIPPNAGLTRIGEDCVVNASPAPVSAKVDYAMSNALGFGGQNSSLIVGRYE